MGHSFEENPIPSKPITILNAPDHAQFFIDVGEKGTFAVRIESLHGRLVLPINNQDHLERTLGGLVDDYIEIISGI